MQSQNLISSLRRPIWPFLALAIAAGPHLGCEPRPRSESSVGVIAPVPRHALPSQSQPAAEAHSGLHRSRDAIAAKIARKEAKIAGAKRATNAEGYARYRYLARRGSDGTIPPNALMAARQQAETMPVIPTENRVLLDAGIWNWEWLGPGNIGGRIRSILIHPTTPNIMWIGGVSGGIWSTTDGGASWTPVNDFLPSLAIGCMAMDPTDPNVMYAGTGEGTFNFDSLPGAGIFKSTDGGDTWTQLPGTVPAGPGLYDAWSRVNRIAVKPGQPRILLAATGDGLYRSTDAGENWSRRLNGYVMDLKFSNADATRAVAGGFGGAIWSSADSGNTWQASGLSSIVPIYQTTLRQAFTADADADNDVLLVVSSAGYNSGDTVQIGTAAGAPIVTVKKVDDPKNGGPNSIVVTDVPASFANGTQLTTTPGGRCEIAWSGNLVFASMDRGGGVVWVSQDQGAGFVVLKDAASTPNYLGGQGGYDNAIWVAPDDPSIIVVAGLDAYRSTDTGQTYTRISDWHRYHSPGDSAHADHHIILPHPNWPNNRTVFFGNDGGIQKVSNLLTATTTSWTNLANNLGITQFYGGAAAPDGSVIVGGSQDNDNLRYRPQDGAQGWYQAQTGDGAFCAIDPVDPSIIYTQYWGHNIEKSTNGGLSYFSVVDGITDLGAGFSVSPIAIDPTNRFILYTGGGEIIWRTTNGAGSWAVARESIGVDNWVACFDVAPDGAVWAGYGSGTVSKTPPVRNWVDVDNNGPNPLPDGRMVTDIAINPSNPDEVWVTFGGYQADQVWFTKDSGQTWQSRSTGLPVIQVNTIRVHPANGDWIYIGTDLGVFASEDEGLTWSRTPRYGNHEGPVNTEVAELFWQGDRLIAATHGRGMYRVRPMAVVYVDWRNGGLEDGSLTYPYNTVIEGIDAAGHGTNLSIHAGDYNETGQVLFNRRGRITATSGTVTIR